MMKKCIVIPDSFKGTMSSMEVCDIMSASIRRAYPDCHVVSIPVADGGEGTVDCFLKAKTGEKIYTIVQNAYGEPIESFYGRFGDIAVVEMAAAAGMVSNDRRDTMQASTYGVGQLIDHAIRKGATKILIGLGGSCTSDAGCGMACALGMKFYDDKDREFLPVGASLDRVRRMDISDLSQRLYGVELACMCDTDKVMYGPDGAAYVYAPQKGATQEEVKVLDVNLRIFAELICSSFGMDVTNMPGGGAAGAMGAGARAFLGAELKPGIDYIMDLVGFEDCLTGADCVFTGEGSFDAQSLSGKAVCGISAKAKKHGVPVIVVCGRSQIDADKDANVLEKYGIAAVHETVREDAARGSACSIDLEEIKRTCREDLASCMDRILSKNIRFTNG